MADPHELRVDVLGNAHEGFVVVVTGDIDLGSAPTVHDRLHGLAAAGPGVVADLAGVTFIDSSGIHALLSSARATEAAAARWSSRRRRPRCGGCSSSSRPTTSCTGSWSASRSSGSRRPRA
jgi:anti-anti-sigma factor